MSRCCSHRKACSHFSRSQLLLVVEDPALSWNARISSTMTGSSSCRARIFKRTLSRLSSWSTRLVPLAAVPKNRFAAEASCHKSWRWPQQGAQIELRCGVVISSFVGCLRNLLGPAITTRGIQRPTLRSSQTIPLLRPPSRAVVERNCRGNF